MRFIKTTDIREVMQPGAEEPSTYFAGSKKLFIGGRWVEAVSGEQFDTINPANGNVIARLASGGSVDVDKAVAAARSAFEGEWCRWKPNKRQRLLLRINDLLLKHGEELATLETVDMGAPLSRIKAIVRWVSQLI